MEEQRAPLQESPHDTPAEPEEEHISSNVCDVCMRDNLLQKVGIIYCNKCRAPFFLHYASKIDVRYCVDCFSEMDLTKEVIHKTYEHYNEVTDTITKYSRKARRIALTGESWLFAQRRIKDMTDAELDMEIEYHRQMFQLIAAEAEERKNRKVHRFAGVRVKVPSTTSSSTTVTVSKKVSKTSSTTAQAKLSALLGTMLAKGMTPDMIAAMLKSK